MNHLRLWFSSRKNIRHSALRLKKRFYKNSNQITWISERSQTVSLFVVVPQTWGITCWLFCARNALLLIVLLWRSFPHECQQFQLYCLSINHSTENCLISLLFCSNDAQHNVFSWMNLYPVWLRSQDDVVQGCSWNSCCF